MVNNPLYLLLLLIPLFIIIRTLKKGLKGKYLFTSLMFTISLSMVILALSGFGIFKDSSTTYSIYLVDLSDSISVESQRETIEIINRELKNTKKSNFSGIVLFGKSSTIEKNLQNNLSEISFESLISGRSTNIEEALYKAISLFPSKGNRRIFLFSDGLETLGNSRLAAVKAASAHIKIYTVPLKSEQPESEVYIKDLIVPSTISKNQIHDYTLLIGSSIKSTALVTFFQNGTYMGEEKILVYPGVNTFTYTSKIDQAGIHEYKAIIEPESDTYMENNTMTVPVKVTGEPKVLLISDSSTSYLKDALSIQEIETLILKPEQLPQSIGSLMQYESIIFENIAAGSISIEQMLLIKDYVKNKGGGFIMIGGDKSFGAGGYYDTAIEEILPVDMDVTSSLQIPSLTMIMLIDRSGSMKTSVEHGINKLDIAKEAILEAVEVLNPFYKVGIIAFDTDYYFAVPLIEAEQLEGIKDQLNNIKTGGGTALYPAMEGAFKELLLSDSSVRHMIILSDGLSDKGDFETLASNIGREGITISTVSVGDDSDRDLLEMIAKLGGGRSYFSSDIRDVPRIFASESFIVSRAHIVEDTFLATIKQDHPILRGLNNMLPPLDGYVLTYPKPGSYEILTTADGHPLLSIWQYGLGRTASWSSDFSGKWGEMLVSSDRFPILAAQLARWVQGPRGSEKLNLKFLDNGSKRSFTIGATNEKGQYINLLELQGILTSPDAIEKRIEVNQSGPGLYKGSFELSSEGTWYLTLFDKKNMISPQVWGFSLPYSQEFNPKSEDINLLLQIAETSGGTLIETKDEPFPDFLIDQKLGTKDMRGSLTLLSLLLFLLGIIVNLLPQKSKDNSDYIDTNELNRLKMKIEQDKKETLIKMRREGFWFGSN